MPKAIVRLSLLALACTASIGSAQAQGSDPDLVARVEHLQAQVRELTGTIEQLQYRNQQLEQQLQQLQGSAANGGPPPPSPRPDVQYAPPAAAPYPPANPSYPPPSPAAPYPQAAPSYPPAGQPQYAQPAYPPSGPPPYSQSPAASPYPPPAVAAAVPVPPPNDPSAGRHGDAFDPTLNPAAPGAPRPLGTSTSATEPPPPVAAPAPRQAGAPLDLSSVSPPPGSAAPGNAAAPDIAPPLPPPADPNAMQATLPPGNTPKDEYDLAYGYVLHKDYGPATDTFRDFLRKYPSDRLVAEAQYWLGESLYQRQQYRDAAESFLAVSTKFEGTPRAPDALLRLGQSLAALGEKEAACASFGEVLRKYPRASAAVKQNVDREQKRVHC
jgi:tol-pal system protein YbgF